MAEDNFIYPYHPSITRESESKALSDLSRDFDTGGTPAAPKLLLYFFANTKEFVEECVSEDITELVDVIDEINSFGKWDLWKDNSPIWARPQDGYYDMYREDLFQVVGHTPVDAPLLTGNVLTLDTFSTYRNGTPIGDERFVWIDTVSTKWDYANYSSFQ